MSRPRTCPNCRCIIGLEGGYHFTANLTMICNTCTKPIYSTEVFEHTFVLPAVKTSLDPWHGWENLNREHSGQIGPRLHHQTIIRRYPPIPFQDCPSHDFLD